MATITAAQTGNWSATATWAGGSLPSADDTADCAGYDVTIDQDVTIVALTNSGDGSFLVDAAHTITADLTCGAGTDYLLKDSHASGTVTIIGALTGSATSSGAILRTGAGQTDISGNITGGSAAAKYGMRNEGTGTVNITGNITGGSNGSASGLINTTTGTVNVTGNVAPGSGVGVYNSLGGTISITGTVTGGVIAGAYNHNVGTLTATRAKSGGSVAAVRGNNSGGTTWVKELEFVVTGADGVGPIGGYCKVYPDSTVNQVIVIRSDTGAALPMSWDYPAEEDVESGVDYALGKLTGTLSAGAGGGKPAFGDRSGGKQ